MFSGLPASRSSASSADFSNFMPQTGILDFSEGAQHLDDSTISIRSSLSCSSNATFCLTCAPIFHI